MAIVALSASPATLDSGGSDFVSVTNTGAVDVTVSRGPQSFTLRPNQSRTVYPEGIAVTAVSSGTGQVTTLAQAAQVTQSQQVAANTAAIAGLPTTYAARTFPASTNGATFLGQWNEARSTYNLAPRHLRRFRAALGKARAGTGLCSVACVGDSITQGYGSTGGVYGTHAWPMRLRDAMVAAGIPSAGTGWVPAANSSPTNDSRFAMGSWSKWSGNTFTFSRTSSTANDTITFTSDVAGTIVEVLYPAAVSSLITVNIDGAGAVAVPTNATTSQFLTYQVTGLANTTHTVVVTRTGSSPFVSGFRVRSASGLDVSNFGLYGSKASDWNINLAADWFRPASAVASLSPHLVLLGLMTNEANTAATAASYATGLGALIGYYKTNSDVVLLAAPPASGLTLDPYREQLFLLADSKDVPVIDLFSRWGSYATQNGYGTMSDGLHPNEVGYADYGQAVTRALLG